MGNLIDLIGMKFGRLTVIRKSEVVKRNGALWVCRCDCGREAVSNSLKLRNGHTSSCGCLKKDTKPNLKHGHANHSKTYRTWKEMRQRCLNPKSDKWHWYGGRGIEICQQWESYDVFLQDMVERPDGTSLDRINPDGNYEPGNCRWATPLQQAETNRGLFKRGMTPYNRTPDQKLQLMRSMRKAGATVTDIAKQFNQEISVVSWLINHGPRPRKN